MDGLSVVGRDGASTAVSTSRDPRPVASSVGSPEFTTSGAVVCSSSRSFKKLLSQSFAGTIGSTTAVVVKLPDTSLFSSVEFGQPAIETTSQLSDRGRFEQVFTNSFVSSVASYVAIVPFVERRMVAAGVAEGADEASRWSAGQVMVRNP